MENQNEEIIKISGGFKISNLGTVKYVKNDRPVNPSKFNIAYLVATAFIPNPNFYPYVIHIDKNKKNNHYNNLKWANNRIITLHARIRKDNKSGFKGVSYNKKKNIWRAEIINNEGKLEMTSYAVRAYPDAKEKCIAWRKDKEKIILENI